MSAGTEASEPKARFISVNDVEYAPADGCAKTFRKHLLTTERLEIQQTSIRGCGEAEDYGVCATNRCAYVLAGTATLMQKGAAKAEAEVGEGHLIVIPAGARWGRQLSVLSDELVLLEIARTVDSGGAPTASSGEPAAEVHAVDPTAVKAYEPLGHAKTTNRCLFADDHTEIIEGVIERGGGAERHSHRNNEQMLYVIRGAGVPVLIYYPKGAPHGTGGGISEPLELLVIYSPPLGESQNALA